MSNLAQIMRHINGAYTTYFNVARKRAGHLFQGRYQAILVEADAYALALSRSMHLNPVRAGMVAKPGSPRKVVTMFVTCPARRYSDARTARWRRHG
jgi:hypothetical protein